MVPSTSSKREVKSNSIMQGRSSPESSMLKFSEFVKVQLEIGRSSDVGANQKSGSPRSKDVRIDRLESMNFESVRPDSVKFDSMRPWDREAIRIHELCITLNRSILNTFESIRISLLRIDRHETLLLSQPSIRSLALKIGSNC